MNIDAWEDMQKEMAEWHDDTPKSKRSDIFMNDGETAKQALIIPET
jgi:hypothetical protein